MVYGEAGVAQSVKCLTLVFCSGHDLRVVRSSPASGSALCVWIVLKTVNLPLPLALPTSLTLSFSKKKDKTKKPPQRYIFYMYRNWSISYNLYSKEKKKYIHLLDYIGIKNLQELKQEMDRTDVSGDAGPWGGFILFCTLCTFWF